MTSYNAMERGHKHYIMIQAMFVNVFKYNGGGSYVVCVVSVGVVDDKLSDGSDNDGIEGTDNGGRPELTN